MYIYSSTVLEYFLFLPLLPLPYVLEANTETLHHYNFLVTSYLLDDVDCRFYQIMLQHAEYLML